MRQDLVVFDIDGCVIDSEHRVDLMHQGKIDQYHAKWVDDKPIKQGLVIYDLIMKTSDLKWVFVTGRFESCREYTQAQLEGMFGEVVNSKNLLMRPDGMTSKVKEDAELKPWLLERAGYSLDRVFLVFEDRNSMVKAWRKLGKVVYQTAEGDF